MSASWSRADTTTIGRRGLAADPPDDAEAIAVGQTEVEHDEIGPAGVPCADGGRGVAGLGDVVAVAAQERRDGLARRLVVLDEQDRRRSVEFDHRIALSGASDAVRRGLVGRGGHRQIDVERESPQIALTRIDAPAHRLDDAADDRETDAGPAARTLALARDPVELLEQPRKALRRDTGPGILDRDPDHLGIEHPRRDPDERTGTGVLGGVVEGVRKDLADEHLVGEDRRQARRNVDLEGAIAEGRPRALEGRIDDVAHGQDDDVRSELAGLDTAHVEEVRDQPVQPLGLAIDRPGDLATLVGRPLDVGVHEGACCRPDRREWRPEVMRDRIEQRRLEYVAAP